MNCCFSAKLSALAPKLVGKRQLIGFLIFILTLFVGISSSKLITRLKSPTIVTLPSGLQYLDLREGSGPSPARGQLLSVRISAILDDGTPFDSSSYLGHTLEFYYETGKVALGVDQGLATMKTGGKRRLTVPYHLACNTDRFAPKLSRDCKSYTPLTFDLELLSIR